VTYYRGDEYDDYLTVHPMMFESVSQAPYEVRPGVFAPGTQEGRFFVPVGATSPYGSGFPSLTAIASVLGLTAIANQFLDKAGGALRPITEAITTGIEGITTATEATSSPASPASPAASSPTPLLPSVTYYQQTGPSQGLVQSARASQAWPARRRQPSRRNQASRRLSPRQRAILSAEVQRLLQQ